MLIYWLISSEVSSFITFIWKTFSSIYFTRDTIATTIKVIADTSPKMTSMSMIVFIICWFV